MVKTITISKQQYDQLLIDLKTLRRTDLYKRLLQFMENIQKKKFARDDLGF